MHNKKGHSERIEIRRHGMKMPERTKWVRVCKQGKGP